jgi:uncharacterized membrane protein SpoIIM required for sporulation
MKVAEFLKQRRENWQELEQLCVQIESRRTRTLGPAAVDRFAFLYRAACADLALADAYQLPPNAVQYLHRLVGHAHNLLYRSRSFDIASWGHSLLVEVPQRIFSDRCLHVAFGLFWGIFVMTTFLGWSDKWPRFAETMLSPEYVDRLESDFAQPIAGRNAAVNPDMAGFYIQHNTGIGLQCFAGGLLLVPGLLVTVFNAAHLGAAFGYMARPDVAAGQNFFHFVTAHGPFELTAIVLSSAAGLRLGMSWIRTNGLRRGDSLRKSSQEAMPLMGAAMIMFFLAALIEGFLSPSSAPYSFKATVAVLSSGILMFYFVVLGYPRQTVSRQSESRPEPAGQEQYDAT